MRLFSRVKKRKVNTSLLPANIVNIGKIKNSEASLVATVSLNTSSPLISNLTVQVKNEGKSDLSNIYVAATIDSGFSLNNDGELFGTSWRMEKIKRLTPNQGIKFKLIIRNNANLNSGSLKISLAPTQEVDEPESICVVVPLKTSLV